MINFLGLVCVPTLYTFQGASLIFFFSPHMTDIKKYGLPIV